MPRKSKSKLTLALQSTPTGKLIAGVGSGVGLEFIKAYFPEARSIIRIASAYFTLRGYKLGREYVKPNVQFRILVGQEEGRNVYATVIDEIVADLGQCETDLWDTVFELVQRMKSGHFIIRDARELTVPFHCKFYICDSKLMWHGSSNYSFKGLRQSAEQVSMSRNANQIRLFTDWYDDVAQNARDLLAELIKKLEDWLGLATPFDVYLKTLFLLNNLAEYPVSTDGYTPIYYQKGVIARALRQANEYGGALIIAATGLGKTVIGAEIASRLQPLGRANQTILIAPEGVRGNWEQQLESRNIYFKFFNIDVLFRKASEHSHHQSARVEKQLQRAIRNQNTVIIIDEAHFYRNELLREKSKRGKSLVYERIVPAVKAGAKIFLLTATAYSTDFLNLNSLLYLLPHRFFNPNLFDEQSPWEIFSAEEFSRLPVVTILGLPHVLKMARNRGDVDTNGRTFIQLGNERRYLPKSMRLHPINYQLFLQSELQAAFDSRCFDQAAKFPQMWFDDEKMALSQSAIDTVYNSSLTSWLSSPIAMVRTIEQNLATSGSSESSEDAPQLSLNLWEQQPASSTYVQDQQSTTVIGEQDCSYGTPMYMSLEERENLLTPLLVQLRQCNYEDDKLRKLQQIIEEHCLQMGGKVIIFVKRYLTAQYLLTRLTETFSGNLSIGCTVETSEINPRLKVALQRSEVLKQFSPRSHHHSTVQEHDVLICTDADGVGVNLQDADTVINYDPPEGADELFQRAGRILRMTTDSERVIHLYIFKPSILGQTQSSSRIQSDICRRFDRLNRRHNKSQSILGSGVISDEDVEVSLESDLDVEQLTRDDAFLGNIGGLGAESILSHTSVLEQFRNRAESLPEYLLSARSYSQPQPRIFVLLRYQSNYHTILFNLVDKKIERQDEFATLDLIACTESEPLAAIQAADIEKLANRVVCLWCDVENISIDQVSKICGLYLAPSNEATQVRRLLIDIDNFEGSTK